MDRGRVRLRLSDGAGSEHRKPRPESRAGEYGSHVRSVSVVYDFLRDFIAMYLHTPAQVGAISHRFLLHVGNRDDGPLDLGPSDDGVFRLWSYHFQQSDHFEWLGHGIWH